MGYSRNNEWETNIETYTESQIEAVLNECDIEYESETFTHFICYCPFHNNNDSPAMAVDKEKGKWICFNPSCNSSGDLVQLVQRSQKLDLFKALRLIHKYKGDQVHSLKERREKRQEAEKLPDFETEVERMSSNLLGSPAQSYMNGRGFQDDTLEYFKVGYSSVRNLVTVPMYSLEGKAVGVIGRTMPPEEKRFRNSKNLPRRKFPWNIHNARKHGDTVIIVEASFCGMKIHQAGYPNVVALLGGFMTSEQKELIDRYFDNIVLMTDFDKKKYEVNCRDCKKAGYRICNGHNAGRDFGRSIIKAFPHKMVKWAAYDNTCVYPTWPVEGLRNGPAKDPTDMTDEEIRQCLKNLVSPLQYNRWNIEETLAS